jgi:hypothetical protein
MNCKDLDERARREYKSVRYYPFDNPASSPFILTSDPLGYLVAWLEQKLNLIQRDSGTKRKKYTKAIYFTQLAVDFNNSAKMARMPSKGTLIYYSLINLVKVYLIINDYDLETKVEHHGLSLPPTYKEKIKLAGLSSSYISIFHEFAKTLGKPIDTSSGNDIKISDLLRSLPEVHELAYALELFPSSKRKFLPVDIVIRTNSARNKLYYTIAYEKKFDKLMKTDKLEKGANKDILTKMEDIEDDPNRRYYKSVLKISYTKTSEASWKICYPKIITDLKKLNIVSMLSRDGYRHYMDLEPTRLHRLSSVLAFAFYLGTVARYRPTLNEEILKGKYQPIINEAITSLPNQFFYLMTSHITSQICAIPKAKLE